MGRPVWASGGGPAGRSPRLQLRRGAGGGGVDDEAALSLEGCRRGCGRAAAATDGKVGGFLAKHPAGGYPLLFVFGAFFIEGPVGSLAGRAAPAASSCGGRARLARFAFAPGAIRAQSRTFAVSCFVPVGPAPVADSWAEVAIVYFARVEPGVPD